MKKALTLHLIILFTMSLVVSLRVPDGVVVAADSLQTTTMNINLPIPPNVYMKDATGKEIPFLIPPISMPSSTSVYAHKLFPFKEKFCVATFGKVVINNRTIYSHIKYFESIFSKDKKIDTLSDASRELSEYFQKQLDEELKITKMHLPKNQFVTGFLVSGFDSPEDLIGHTIEVIIGETPRVNKISGIGCTVGGDQEVVANLWSIAKQNPIRNPSYGAFSLKDAIDYAEFLINTTALFQRFTNVIPSVGGAVDIALITNYSDRFKWIKCKDLTRVIEDC
jgi:hypothetical protein